MVKTHWSFDGGRQGIDLRLHEVCAWEQQAFGGGVGASWTLEDFVAGDGRGVISRSHGEQVLAEVVRAAELTLLAKEGVGVLPADASLRDAHVPDGAVPPDALALIARVHPRIAAAIEHGGMRLTGFDARGAESIVAADIAGYFGVRMRFRERVGLTHRGLWPWETGGSW